MLRDCVGSWRFECLCAGTFLPVPTGEEVGSRLLGSPGLPQSPVWRKPSEGTSHSETMGSHCEVPPTEAPGSPAAWTGPEASQAALLPLIPFSGANDTGDYFICSWAALARGFGLSFLDLVPDLPVLTFASLTTEVGKPVPPKLDPAAVAVPRAGPTHQGGQCWAGTCICGVMCANLALDFGWEMEEVFPICTGMESPVRSLRAVLIRWGDLGTHNLRAGRLLLSGKRANPWASLELRPGGDTSKLGPQCWKDTENPVRNQTVELGGQN